MEDSVFQNEDKTQLTLKRRGNSLEFTSMKRKTMESPAKKTEEKSPKEVIVIDDPVMDFTADDQVTTKTIEDTYVHTLAEEIKKERKSTFRNHSFLDFQEAMFRLERPVRCR